MTKKLILAIPKKEEHSKDTDMYEVEYAKYSPSKFGEFKIGYSRKNLTYTELAFLDSVEFEDNGSGLFISIKEGTDTKTIGLDYSQIMNLYILLRVYMKEDEQDVTLLSGVEEY